MIFELFLLFVALLVLVLIFKKDGKNYPPGPFEIPFIGSGAFYNDQQITRMHKKYGDIFTSKLGCTRFIYLSEYKLMKEAFMKPEYSSRIDWDIIYLTDAERQKRECSGIVLSKGGIWQHNRRFIMRHLRDLGMGKSRMADVILREVETLVEGFKEICDKPTKIPFILDLCVLNVVWEMVGGHHYSLQEAPEVQKFIKTFNNAQEDFMIAGVPEFFPILKNILPNIVLDKIFKVNSFLVCMQEFKKHIEPFVEEHKKNLDAENPNDFIDDYLIDMIKEKDNPDSMFTEDELYGNIFDLFVAGMDTTAKSISWLMLYMAEHQEEQRKCQEILDEVVEKGGLPGLEHRDKLVYIDATINEVSRMASFANFGVLHSTTEDCELKGYFIPKKSLVAACAGFSHKDPRYWDDPLSFNPSRFISDEGKFISQKEGFLPFGIGRRQCVGESLARMEVFLMSAAILKNFNINPCEGEKVDLNPKKVHMLNIPNLNQKIVFSLRKV